MRFFPFPRLPEDHTEHWIISFSPSKEDPELKGRFAYTHFNKRLTVYGVNITVYLIWLLICLSGFFTMMFTTDVSYWSASIWLMVSVLLPIIFTIMVVRHERAHANGIDANGCKGDNKWCVCAEEHLVNGSDRSFMDKFKLLRYQIVGFGRYCNSCKSYMISNRLRRPKQLFK
jgi:hypothetical protein